MATVQQAIQAKATAIVSKLKFKGSDAQKQYAAGVAEYRICIEAMSAVIRGEDWGGVISEKTTAWEKKYKIRGGLNASEFITQEKSDRMQEKGMPASEKIRASFPTRVNAEILDSEI